MCGIAGYIGFEDNGQQAERANRLQYHRGPDHQCVWSDDRIALAHQRLSIIDLDARSNQPFVKDGLVVIFNGEVYNYKDIQQDLAATRGTIFQTTSDTEVVLEAYRAYGAGCLDYFIGMFAFAIYDPASGRLFLARDHYGIKPLFYAKQGSRFCFASELKTLVVCNEIDKSINYKALISSLNYQWVPGDDTMFSSISKLPPGHYMRLDNDLTVDIVRYATPVKSSSVGSEKTAAELLDKEFNSSIRRHMVADVPISSFLSGGLDSSLISVMASAHTDELSTYTIGTKPEDKKIERMPEDELYARKLAELHRFDHNEIVIDSSIVDLLPKIVRTLDEPIGDPAAINTFLICEAARKRGVKVLLSGMGADEIFFGYRRQRATLFAMRYRQYIPSVLRAVIKTLVGWLPVKFMGRGLRLVRWAQRFLNFADLPLSQSYMQSYSYYSKSELHQLLKKDHSDDIERIYSEHERIFDEAFQGDPINQMCNTDIQMFMIGLNLTYTDRASMAASVEVRVPFIDKEVIRTAMSFNGSLKYHNGESKFILKKVAEGYLPEDIIYRPKASFGAPVRSWISGALKGTVDDLLSVENIEKRGLFNSDFVRKLVDEDRQGLKDNAYRIYQLLTIELWFRGFVDGGGIATDTR